MSAVAFTGTKFLLEHLRVPTTVAMLVIIPVLFVVASASVLGDFSKALGGTVAGTSTGALGAGWAAAFLAGALGFFQVNSSRDADRRLALAGLGALRVAVARVGTSVVLGVVVSGAAYFTLWLVSGLERPALAAVAILAFALIYIGIGTLIGSFVMGQLEGALLIVFIFLIDIFSGPGMARGSIAHYMPTGNAAEVLTDAGRGVVSPAGDWVAVAITVAASVTVAFAAFWLSARART